MNHKDEILYKKIKELKGKKLKGTKIIEWEVSGEVDYKFHRKFMLVQIDGTEDVVTIKIWDKYE